MNLSTETEINLISEGTLIEGKFTIQKICRLHGTLKGEVFGKTGSQLIIGETGLIEGNIQGHEVVINGTVIGNVRATHKLIISKTGRLIGDILSPTLVMDFGAHFEGKATPQPSPA